MPNNGGFTGTGWRRENNKFVSTHVQIYNLEMRKTKFVNNTEKERKREKTKRVIITLCRKN
jgi:hypothetical protein